MKATFLKEVEAKNSFGFNLNLSFRKQIITPLLSLYSHSLPSIQPLANTDKFPVITILSHWKKCHTNIVIQYATFEMGDFYVE